jgi:hypothetical protein
MSYASIYTTISLFLSVHAAFQSSQPSQRGGLYRCHLPTSLRTITTKSRQLCKSSLCNNYHYGTTLLNKVQSEDDKEVEDNDNGVATLRDEIERMKEEARQKLNSLEKSFSSQSSTSTCNTASSAQEVIMDGYSVIESNALVSTVAIDSDDDILMISSDVERESNDNYLEKTAISNKVSQATPVAYDELSLLDNTTWKISLNIGREPNTWYELQHFL